MCAGVNVDKKEPKTGNKNKKEGMEIVEIPFENLVLPECLKDNNFSDLLSFILSENLSATVMSMFSKARIHAVGKTPGAKNGKYVVVGGLLFYLILLRSGWRAPIFIVVDHGLEKADQRKNVMSDIMLLFSLKRDPVVSGALATLLLIILEIEERDKFPAGLSLKRRNIFMSRKALLKEITGYDPRAFNRSQKTNIPNPLLDLIYSILGSEPKKKEVSSVADEEEQDEQ